MEDIYSLESQIKEYLRNDFNSFDAKKLDFIKHVSNAILVYDKQNFSANYALGILNCFNDNDPNAIMHFTRCLSHPKNMMIPAVHLQLATIYVSREDFESAHYNFSAALCYRKMELEEQINDKSKKIQENWIPGEVAILSDKSSAIQRVKDYLRAELDKATHEMFDLNNLELKLSDMESNKKYVQACNEFHEYWTKYGND